MLNMIFDLTLFECFRLYPIADTTRTKILTQQTLEKFKSFRVRNPAYLKLDVLILEGFGCGAQVLVLPADNGPILDVCTASSWT